MKIAIYGGSFDPPHIGHVAIAKRVSRLVDQVWMMPCYGHMFNKKLRLPKFRLSLCRFAVDDIQSNVVASNFDIENQFSGSTYESLLRLKKAYPQHEFSFVVGQDNADMIEQWKYWIDLIEDFPAIVCQRQQVINEFAWYMKPPHTFVSDWWQSDLSLLSVSSTLIRESLKDGTNYARNHLLPEVYRAAVTSTLYL